MTDNRAEGLKVFKELLPGLVPDDATTLRDDGFAGEIGELGLEHVFGALWTRPGLDRRSRSLVTLGALIALRAENELRGHVRGALRNGLTRAEIVEAVIHAGAYCGAPAGLAAMRVVQEVLEAELGPRSEQD